MKVDVDIFQKLGDKLKKLGDKSIKLVDKQSKVLDKSQNCSPLKIFVAASLKTTLTCDMVHSLPPKVREYPKKLFPSLFFRLIIYAQQTQIWFSEI